MMTLKMTIERNLTMQAETITNRNQRKSYCLCWVILLCAVGGICNWLYVHFRYNRMFHTFSGLRRPSTGTYTATLSASGKEEVKQVNYRADPRVPLLRFLQSLKETYTGWTTEYNECDFYRSFIYSFSYLRCIFCLFTLCGLLFIAFCSSCFLYIYIYRIFVCETLGGELRRMIWTLGIITLFGRYLAVLYLAHSLIYSSLSIFCFLSQTTVQFILFSASFISIYYPHIPSL